MSSEIATLFPAGHFYSPICDPVEVKKRKALLWPAVLPAGSLGIDYRVDAQLELLKKFAEFSKDIEFLVEEPVGEYRYFYLNDQYPCLDAEVLYSFLRMLRPKAFVEVGSGFSTLLTAEVNRKYLDGAMRFTLVEPYPRQFLIDGVDGVSRLIQDQVESVHESLFETLGTGDILFIDSSHVSKTGSDVNFLFFEILPLLKPGVYVHIHDIFLPDEYRQDWVIEQGRNWNEQYLVRAFLQFNNSFEVVWGSHLMATRQHAETATTFPNFLKLGSGGSLWLRRI